MGYSGTVLESIGGIRSYKDLGFGKDEGSSHTKEGGGWDVCSYLCTLRFVQESAQSGLGTLECGGGWVFLFEVCKEAIECVGQTKELRANQGATLSTAQHHSSKWDGWRGEPAPRGGDDARRLRQITVAALSST